MRFLWSFLILCSCTMIQEEKNISSNVSLGSENSSIVIDQSVEINKNSESEKKIINPEVGIFLYPTIYSSMGLIELLRQLERAKVKVNTIGSFGFGAVIAALYAKEGTTSYLEWKMFALLRKLESLKPYEKEWRNEVLAFLRDEFKKQTVSDLKLNLFIPFIDNDSTLKKDRVVDILEKSINLSEKRHYINTNDFEIELDSYVKTDLQYNVLFLPKNIGFDRLTSYNYGLYTYYLGKVMQMDETVKILRAETSVKLDKIYSSSDIYTMYFSQIVELQDLISEQISRWREDNSASLLNYNN